MREIEIKASVADRAVLMQKLQEASVTLGDPVTQRDQVFGLPNAVGGGDNHAPWLRLRTETREGATKYVFTLKKSVTNQMDSIEHETEVTDPLEVIKIIEHIGFTPYSDSTKVRKKAQIDDIELCVDTVEGLGDFIEAEKLTEENADYDTVAATLWMLLESLGVARDAQVTDGYDVLIRAKQGLKG